MYTQVPLQAPEPVPVPVFGIVALVVLVLAAVTVWKSVVMVEAYDKEALTVFGEYRGLLEPGLNVIPPFISRTYRFDMRTQTMDVPRQEAITRDNSPVTADAVVYLRVMDAERAFLEVDVEEMEQQAAAIKSSAGDDSGGGDADPDVDLSGAEGE